MGSRQGRSGEYRCDDLMNETRILVAEDDIATHDEWQESLAAWGFRVETAEDGEQAPTLIATSDRCAAAPDGS